MHTTSDRMANPQLALLPDPKVNHLLAALPEAEWQRWKDQLEPVEMPLGQVLYVSGRTLSHAYFPTTAIVSLLYLGIAGLAAMVLLLGYPLRKHLRPLRRAGRIGIWFQAHMLLGLFGPLAVLYHSNFRLGTTNSNVALASVLIVAGSGVIGRGVAVDGAP